MHVRIFSILLIALPRVATYFLQALQIHTFADKRTQPIKSNHNKKFKRYSKSDIQLSLVTDINPEDIASSIQTNTPSNGAPQDGPKTEDNINESTLQSKIAYKKISYTLKNQYNDSIQIFKPNK